ncbi:MAG: regulatory iron-sulfur-containing complex subunit RicT [Verrucomicrobiota bacterium]|nr:regulatory iron-sulfur-containing complex subunit RicT [Verrucomicrobiota bacterium]
MTTETGATAPDTKTDPSAGQRIAIVEVAEGVRLACTVPRDLAIHEGDQCVMEHDRILEFGRAVKLLGPEEQRDRWRLAGVALRCATLQDQAKAKESAVMGRMAWETVKSKARKRGITLRIARARYSFDRAVLMILFVSDERLDLKELVGELAGELRTRVDIQQIGARDEASLLGGLGPCGRELCCCAWLRRFDQVNVRMAKAQGIAPNPAVISGMCGRLKCCLRYEYEQYRDLERLVPREGTIVECPAGRGEVVCRNTLARRVKVRLDGDHLVEYDATEVRKVWGDEKRKTEEKDERKSEEIGDEDPGAEWAEP